MRKPKQRKPNDLSREMSLSGWLVAGILLGVRRQPLKKLKTDACALLELLHRWRAEAERAGHISRRTTVAFEAGRDGFWLGALARNTRHRSACDPRVEYRRVMEHRRAKTDRLDTDLLQRSFLGWLRGERDQLQDGGHSNAP